METNMNKLDPKYQIIQACVTGRPQPSQATTVTNPPNGFPQPFSIPFLCSQLSDSPASSPDQAETISGHVTEKRNRNAQTPGWHNSSVTSVDSNSSDSVSSPTADVFEESSSTPTADKALSRLENGLVVMLHTSKKKPENLTVCLRRELADLVFLMSHGSKQPHIMVDLCQVKKVVALPQTKSSQSFRERSNCITLFYGSTFVLQTVTFAAKSVRDYQTILTALETYLLELKWSDPYTSKQRWLSREFSRIHTMIKRNSAERRSSFVTQDLHEMSASVRQVQSWFSQMTDRVKKDHLKLLCAKLNLPEALNVGHFCALVNEVLKLSHPIIEQKLKEHGQPVKDGTRFLPASSFHKFLQSEQAEFESLHQVVEKMHSCLPASQRQQVNPGFSAAEFEDYLYSSLNSVVNPVESSVHQCMDYPLCDYWIASSHNTYLTGDQWRGESQVETYARCLQMGCRCVELDCWDGSSGPVITHGNTLTTKILAADVLQIIKDNAWVVSEYPLVLSLENHCSLQQQKQFASLLKEIFQDDLLTEPVDLKETKLPSPHQLRRKIIIKNKKLQTDKKATETKYEEMTADLRKHGTLRLKYAGQEKWTEVDVILTDSLICFTPHLVAQQEEETHDNIYNECPEDYGYSDDDKPEEEGCLSSQLWYHGAIDRNAAEQLLVAAGRGLSESGIFLVRDGHQGDLVLSFCTRGTTLHSKIKERLDKDGHKLFMVGSEHEHHSIPELVDFYRRHKLTSKDKKLHLSLSRPILRQLGFETERWYKPNMDRWSSEEYLKAIPGDGAFLVRPSSLGNCYTISLRYHRKVTHYQIEFKQGKFILGTFHFPSMQQLVKYFTEHPLYKSARLILPATDELKQDEWHDEIYESSSVYYHPVPVAEQVTVSARTLYDYHAASPDELSFQSGSLITNIIATDESWWRGDCGGNSNKLFPANYVEIVSDGVQDNKAPTEAMLTLSECNFDNRICSEGNLHYFNIMPSSGPALQFGSDVRSEVEEWLTIIQDCHQRQTMSTEMKLKQKRSRNIAPELSDLVIYCQAVQYSPDRIGHFSEMSSFSEERITKDDRTIIQYNQSKLSRVYPKFLRVTSTNFDPLPKWCLGCQMVALNYQTPDKYMQVNQAMFARNGRCGYVMKPRFMNNINYDPGDTAALKGQVEPIVLMVTVLGGRNLASMTSILADMQPFVAVEVLGLPLDCHRERTRMKPDKNMLNPVWKNEVFIFQIFCPDLAFLRFEVGSEVNDMSCLSQATIHLLSLRTGYRSVQLQNSHSEPLSMSSLLVHISIKSTKQVHVQGRQETEL